MQRTAVIAIFAAIGMALAFAFPQENYVCPFASCDPECNPCQPAIDPHTNIEPVPGMQAAAEIVPDYGNCPVTYRGYRWHVSWGDGITSTANTSALMPATALHIYQKPGSYNVSVAYCAEPHYCCDKCSFTSKVINVNS